MATKPTTKKTAKGKETRHILERNAAAAEAATAEMDGVDYDPIAGANCPNCYMQKIGVRNTLPWESGLRVRYHICGRCGKTVKSVEKRDGSGNSIKLSIRSFLKFVYGVYKGFTTDRYSVFHSKYHRYRIDDFV